VVEEIPSPSHEHNPDEEPDILKTAVESIFTQYQSLFDKAKIFEVKKINGIIRQVINYFNGYVKRKSEH
jgi:hypothetical protein